MNNYKYFNLYNLKHNLKFFIYIKRIAEYIYITNTSPMFSVQNHIAVIRSMLLIYLLSYIINIYIQYLSM